MNLKKLIPFLILLVVGFSLFGPFLENPFLMDDEIQITGNRHIQDLNLWPSYFTSSTMDGGGSSEMRGIYYKPLLTSYYAVIWHFFPNDPTAMRIPLLLAHIVSASLIFLFLSRFFLAVPALLASLIFLVHPINSEIVAYVADAQDALYMMFGLCALTCAIYFQKKTWLILSVSLLLVCSLLSKETGALFMAILTMYAFIFERQKFKSLLSVSIVISLVYYFVRSSVGLMSLKHSALLLHRASLIERWQTVPSLIWHYIEVFFLPWRVATVTDFVVRDPLSPEFWLPLSGVILFISLLVWLGRKNPSRLYFFAVGILSFCLALHSNFFFPLDGAYADRWFYLGTWALLIFLLILTRPSHSSKLKFIAPSIAIISIFSVVTFVRLQDWRDPIQLYRREIQYRPWDHLMINNVGVELFRRGQANDAEPYFEKVTELYPHWDVGWNNLGAVAQNKGQTERALNLYEKSASLGSYYLAYENFARLLCSTQQLEKCRKFLNERALPNFPRNPVLIDLDSRLKRLGR